MKAVVEYKGAEFELDSATLEIRNARTGRKLKVFVDKSKGGYAFVAYRRRDVAGGSVFRTARVHRLFARAFVPNPRNLPQVNHLDEDKANYRPSNLAWCSARENLLYSRAWLRQRRTKGTKGPFAPHPVIATLPDGRTVRFDGVNAAARAFGVCKRAVSACAKGCLKTLHGIRFAYAKEQER